MMDFHHKTSKMAIHKTGFDISCQLSGDTLREMSNYVFWEKYEKYFKLSPAENFYPQIVEMSNHVFLKTI